MRLTIKGGLQSRAANNRVNTVFETEVERDAEFFDQYKEKINELLRNRFARKVPSDWKPGRSKVWIIPHHACCTAGKFRVVFDYAAGFGGVSLIDHLLQGPDNERTARSAAVVPTRKHCLLR